jgi:proteasome lid subunit RPN8/RPN11
MAAQKQQTQLLQYTGDKDIPFKLIISTELETKIRTFCALSPDREWSGVLFYLFEGNFENGVTIHANDLYLMDQGSGVHTEFDLDAPEITRHLFMEGLMDHCMGLIHSHNQMKAFFSGEDRDTLITHGSHMHNFVSLVVNNDGNYVARLTRQVNLNGTEEKIVRGTYSSPLFNTDEVEENHYERHESNPIKGSFLEYIDLDIVKESPNISALHSAIERFGEINSKCSSQKTSAKSTSPFIYNPKDYSKPFDPTADWSNKNLWEKEVQGKLFDEPYEDDGLVITREMSDELKSIPWKTLGYDKWLAQLLYGSPFANYTELDKSSINHLNKLYKDRFGNEVMFASWFDIWLDFLISDFDFPVSNRSQFMDSEEAIIYKTYMVLSSKDLIYKNVMLKSLSNRIV